MNGTRTQRRRATLLRLASLLGVVGLVLAFGGSASSAPTRATLTTINLDLLPISNGFPLDLGIQKGFFAAQGLEIKKTTFASGNDIVLAMANNQGDIGYIGWVPGDDRPHAGDRLHGGRGERQRGNLRGRQLAEHHGQGRQLDSHAAGPRRQDDRRQRPQRASAR